MLAVEVAGLDWLPSVVAFVGGILLTLGLVLTIWAGWARDPGASAFPEALNADEQRG